MVTVAQPNNSHLNKLYGLMFIVAAMGLALTVIFQLPATAAQPKAVIPQTTHDFGEALQDKEFSHTFIVKNAGKAPLKILEVDPDCACTVPSYDREIAPGKEGKITLKLKPFSVVKKFTKKTKIRFNDPDNPMSVLVVTGYAKPIIEIIPSHIVRFRGGLNEEHQADIRFISHMAEPWEIKAYQTNLQEKIEVSIKAEEPGKVYVVRVKNKQKEPGHYAGKIYLTTTSEKRPRLLVRVFADLFMASAVNP
jgi:hypothetical protein